MTDNLKDREAFEAALSKNSDVRFWNTTDAMFWAWRAAIDAALAARGAVPAGWAMVPLETLEEWLKYMEADWERIDGEWGPTPGGLEGALLVGDYPEISTLREFVEQAKEIAQAKPEQAALTTCNCRWEGDTQVQQCTLHEAHIEAIHEWAERAKTAEAKLADHQKPKD